MCVSGHDSGPVLEEQPSSLIYPEGLTEGKVILTCQARANPAASYRCTRKLLLSAVVPPRSSKEHALDPVSRPLTRVCRGTRIAS